MKSVQKLVAYVVEAHRTLMTETDLSPHNPKINEALTALVTGIVGTWSSDDERKVLSDPRVQATRREMVEKLAVAEGEMEKYWARIFCDRPSLTSEDFKDFMYWACYDRLVNGEIKKLPPGLRTQKGESIAFTGAGPLPLTAIILHLKTGMNITCVDIDPQACELARTLCKKAGLTGIDVQCCDGAAFDYKNSPAVFIASLVPEKKKVIERIRECRPGALVALRSVERLHTLLYEPVDEDEMRAAGCALQDRTTHDPKTINTTVFYTAGPAPHSAPAITHQRQNRKLGHG